MRHIILSTLFIFACLHAYGQEYVEYDYLKEAADCLAKGDYRCVRSNYNLYQAWQNVDMSAQIQMAEECYKNIIIADNYFNEKEYEKARNHYKTVLDKNPKDSYAKKRYDECVRQLGNNSGTAAQPISDNINGVVINGVRWATRNVDRPGTFAATSEDFGMFYQWNRKTARSATGKKPTDWNNSKAGGNRWKKANDPSPAGWRVPTLDEIKTLCDTDKVSNERITKNGVTGTKFTDKATGNSIFLPAAGYCPLLDDDLYDVGSYSGYWSSTAFDELHSYDLHFLSGNAYWGTRYRFYGQSVRSVAE